MRLCWRQNPDLCVNHRCQKHHLFFQITLCWWCKVLNSKLRQMEPWYIQFCHPC